jgi:hypothetical protein
MVQVPPQATPQPPQLAGSVCSFTHVPMQSDSPPGHAPLSTATEPELLPEPPPLLELPLLPLELPPLPLLDPAVPESPSRSSSVAVRLPQPVAATHAASMTPITSPPRCMGAGRATGVPRGDSGYLGELAVWVPLSGTIFGGITDTFRPPCRGVGNKAMRLEDTPLAFGNTPSSIDEPSIDFGKRFVSILEQSFAFEDKEFLFGCQVLDVEDTEFVLRSKAFDVERTEFVIDCKAFDVEHKERVFGCKAIEVGNTSSSIEVSSIRVVEQSTRRD